VAVEEDPRALLTTNLVNVDLDTVDVGMRVKVLFEHVDDVWLPLFEPDEGDVAVLPLDEVSGTPWRFVRPMVTIEKYESKSAITGIGISKIGRRLGVPALQLTVDACEAALADAGLTFDDIDGLSSWPGMVPVPGFAEGGVLALEDALGIRATGTGAMARVSGRRDQSSTRRWQVAAGLARHVLCFRTVWQSTYADMLRPRWRRKSLRHAARRRTSCG